MTAALRASLAGALLSATHLLAAEPPAAQPLSAVPVVSLVQVVLALLAVLAAVALFAWFLRRVSPAHAGVAGLRVVGGLMVGPRERLVIVEIADTWLLLGVAGSGVSLVHSMPRPADAAVAGATDARFSRLLGQVLKKRTRAG